MQSFCCWKQHESTLCSILMAKYYSETQVESFFMQFPKYRRIFVFVVSFICNSPFCTIRTRI
uniref:Uncharacterized protein n=1 Tax=Rhizophora mucronata TaxID=61149 RepID=A0A2P2IR86_RHIMU